MEYLYFVSYHYHLKMAYSEVKEGFASTTVRTKEPLDSAENLQGVLDYLVASRGICFEPEICILNFQLMSAPPAVAANDAGLDLSDLKKLVDDYIEYLRGPDSHEDDDESYKHNISSAALALLYGPNAFKEIVRPLLDARDEREDEDDDE